MKTIFNPLALACLFMAAYSPCFAQQKNLVIHRERAKESGGGLDSSLHLTKLKSDWEVVSVKGEGTFRWRAANMGDRIRIADVSLNAGSYQDITCDYYIVSPVKTPREFDVVFWVHNLFLTQHGIYELEGDSLRLCVAPYQAARPTKFVAELGKSSLLVLKRITSAKNPAQREMPVFETAAQLKAMPPGKATLEQTQPCASIFRTANGKQFVIGNPSSKPVVQQFLKSLKKGQAYEFPRSFLDYQKAYRKDHPDTKHHLEEKAR